MLISAIDLGIDDVLDRSPGMTRTAITGQIVTENRIDVEALPRKDVLTWTSSHHRASTDKFPPAPEISGTEPVVENQSRGLSTRNRRARQDHRDDREPNTASNMTMHRHPTSLASETTFLSGKSHNPSTL